MSLDYCANLVRTQHRDRYIASLFAPDEKRGALLGLYAFDAEIARIAGLVSEAQLGEIRLQWWRDTVETIGSSQKTDHPVAGLLADAIRMGRLPLQSLLNLIEARSRELYADPMPGLNDLEGYLGETRSAVLQMAAQVLAEDAVTGLADAAGYGGVAQGIAELLQAKPQLPHGGQHLLPELPIEDLLAVADKRLAQYREAAQPMSTPARRAFLPIATTEARLSAIRRKGVGQGISPLRAQWLIWRASRRC